MRCGCLTAGLLAVTLLLLCCAHPLDGDARAAAQRVLCTTSYSQGDTLTCVRNLFFLSKFLESRRMGVKLRLKFRGCKIVCFLTSPQCTRFVVNGRAPGGCSRTCWRGGMWSGEGGGEEHGGRKFIRHGDWSLRQNTRIVAEPFHANSE